MWTCEKCKVINSATRAACMYCQTPRPVQPDDLLEVVDPEAETKELKALKPEER